MCRGPREPGWWVTREEFGTRIEVGRRMGPTSYYENKTRDGPRRSRPIPMNATTLRKVGKLTRRHVLVLLPGNDDRVLARKVISQGQVVGGVLGTLQLHTAYSSNLEFIFFGEFSLCRMQALMLIENKRKENLLTLYVIFDF